MFIRYYANVNFWPLLLLFVAGLFLGVNTILDLNPWAPLQQAEDSLIASAQWVNPSLPRPSASQHGAKESVQLSSCHHLVRTLHFIASELRLEIPWQEPHLSRLVFHCTQFDEGTARYQEARSYKLIRDRSLAHVLWPLWVQCGLHPVQLARHGTHTEPWG